MTVLGGNRSSFYRLNYRLTVAGGKRWPLAGVVDALQRPSPPRTSTKKVLLRREPECGWSLHRSGGGLMEQPKRSRMEVVPRGEDRGGVEAAGDRGGIDGGSNREADGAAEDGPDHHRRASIT